MVRPTKAIETYRPAAGAAVFNAQGQIWLGRRSGEATDYVWQMPQGGIDAGEDAPTAALRELHEETGIALDKVSYLGRVEDDLFYDFPEEYRTHRRTKNWTGQRQSWFAYRFLGTDSDININAQIPPEFSEWRWGELAETPALIVPFKRKVYEYLTVAFADYARAVK